MVFFSLWLNMKVISPSLQSRKINFEGIQIRQILNSHFNSIINRMYICLLWVCSNYNVHTSSSYVKSCWVKEKKKRVYKTTLEFQRSREINELFMQYCCFVYTSPILTLSDRLKRQFFRIVPPAPEKTAAFNPNPTQIRTAPSRRSFRSKRQWLHRRH